MGNEQMIAKMRQIEDALPPLLEQLVILQKREMLPNDTITNYYQIPYGKRPPGYLWINYNKETMEVLAAEMNVNFDCLIGLNRSPIELRLLANHVLQYLP